MENGWRIGLFTAPHDPSPDGRIILDYEFALQHGFNGIIRQIGDKIVEETSGVDKYPTIPDEVERVVLWLGMIRTLEGTIRWARRYGEKARELSNVCRDRQRRMELLEIAKICDVFGEPPQTFRESLQTFWFTYLVGHIEGSHLGYSPGRMDQYLYPFYKKDVEEGIISEEGALELLEDLFTRFAELEYVASFSWSGLGSGNLFQNCILGGLDEDGNPADNEFSQLIIQAQINMQYHQPTLSVWYHPKLSEDFLQKAINCVKTGVGYPAFFKYDN